jgi:hypothetical protein
VLSTGAKQQQSGGLDLNFLILKRTLTRDRHFFVQLPQAQMERKKAFLSMEGAGVFESCGLALFSYLGGKAGKHFAVRQGIGIHDGSKPYTQHHSVNDTHNVATAATATATAATAATATAAAAATTTTATATADTAAGTAAAAATVEK